MAIQNIWQNNFYNTPPLPKWAFEGDFRSLINDSYYENDLKMLGQAIVSCTWGRREVSVVNTFFGGVQANFPGRVSNANELTIKFNENQELSISKILENLFNIMANNQSYFKYESEYSLPNSINYYKSNEITIILKKPNEKVSNESEDSSGYIGKVVFHNCFIKTINEEELSYESDEEVLTKTAVFSYDWMEFEDISSLQSKNVENDGIVYTANTNQSSSNGVA